MKLGTCNDSECRCALHHDEIDFEDEDTRPVINSPLRVPLRSHAAPGGVGALEFMLSHGDGVIDGIEFFVGASLGCNLTVTFKRGNRDLAADPHSYTISAHDLIRVAYEIDKQKPD